MFLVVIGPCHDTVMYLNQAYSVLYQSPSQAISVSLQHRLKNILFLNKFGN